jgi:CoA:oxalate CoA-transferase
MAGALEGIRVLDLTRVLAGPYATMVLADLGAEVIKIEIPGTGDDSRQFGPYCNGESAYFMSLNRNKRSITMNLKLEQARALFLEMIPKVDVLVENFRPGAMDRLGLGYEILKQHNPALIYAASSGFGHTGPYSQRPAYDAVVQAMGGIMSLTSPEYGGPPTRVGTSVGDITAGLFTAIGILAAVYHRQQTGQGQFVDVAMLDCQVAILENAISRFTLTGEVPCPTGNRHPSIVPFEPFQTADGQIMLAVGNDAIWKTFCRVAGLDDLCQDTRFNTNSRRGDHHAELKPLLAIRMLEKTTAQWQQIFDESGVPNGPINRIDQVLQDPQVLARQMIQEIDHPLAGKMKIPGIPVKLSETPGEIKMPAPMLGEHTDYILKEVFGYSEPEIEQFRSQGVFGQVQVHD